MKSFFQWAEENKHELPVFDAPEAEKTDAAPGRKTTDEKAVRTGYSGNYPPAYKRAQYPDAWFAPRKATVPLDKQNMNKPLKDNA